jgi:hypothetical protein
VREQRPRICAGPRGSALPSLLLPRERSGSCLSGTILQLAPLLFSSGVVQISAGPQVQPAPFCYFFEKVALVGRALTPGPYYGPNRASQSDAQRARFSFSDSNSFSVGCVNNHNSYAPQLSQCVCVVSISSCTGLASNRKLLNDDSRIRRLSISFPHACATSECKGCLPRCAEREICWIEPLCQLTRVRCAARSRCSLFPSGFICG